MMDEHCFPHPSSLLGKRFGVRELEYSDPPDTALKKENSPSGNPLGPLVEQTIPAKLPPDTPLTGRLVTLLPRRPSHADDLFDVLGGAENAALWDYIPHGPFLDREEMRSVFNAPNFNSGDPFFYTVINNSSQKAVGSISLLRIDPSNLCIEVGNIVLSYQLQRTAAATEVQYLLARLVFETLGYRRYEWKCHNLNEPSKRAGQRLGFKFEGVFRQHMIVKGRNRDTWWGSIIDGEWPAVKKGFQRWLDDGNFDEEGRQLKGLATLRTITETSYGSEGRQRRYSVVYTLDGERPAVGFQWVHDGNFDKEWSS